MFESEELVCLGKGTGLWPILPVAVKAVLVSVVYLVSLTMIGIAAIVEVVACSKNTSQC